LLVVADAGELRGLVRGTPAQPFLDENNSRMFDSIRSVTSSAVGALDYVAQQSAPRFSVREWVNEDTPGVLFIPYKAGQIAALRSTISGWMRLAIFETMDRRGPNPRLWFVADELDALGQIDGLKDALARLRKFNGRCVLGFQSVAQVSSTYGQGDAHTIVENCGNTLILRCSASEGGGTARFASQLIGEREVMRTTVSRSRRITDVLGSVAHNQHFSMEPAVLPAQIEQLPDLAGYLKYASDPTWQRVRLDAKSAWREIRSGEARAGRENAAQPPRILSADRE
jgi:type IV secretory pathway TraG/TraD family ATPase VirD4